MTEPRWRTSATCSHTNNEVCPTCDHDRYYATAYPGSCPWAVSPESSDPSNPATEPVPTITAPIKSVAKYDEIGPRRASDPRLAIEFTIPTGLSSAQPRRDWLNEALSIVATLLALAVGGSLVLWVVAR